MLSRHLSRALLLLMFVLSPAVSQAEEDIPVTIRNGRITSWTGVALLGAGALSAGLGGGLTIYAPPKSLRGKYNYDKHFVRRLRIGESLAISSIFTASTAIPFFIVGPLVESGGLRRVEASHPVMAGWAGLATLGAGLTLTQVGAAISYNTAALLVVGWGVSGVGIGLCMAQMGLNFRTARRMSPERRKMLYAAPRKRVQVSVAPVLSRESKGLALVGVW